jgi:hypothetical protein
MKFSDIVFEYNEIWQYVLVMFTHITCLAFANKMPRACVIAPRFWKLVSAIIYCLLSTTCNVPPNKSNKTSYNHLVIHILCSWNTWVCAEDNSCFFFSHTMMAGLWYWVDNLYKCCNWMVLTGKWILRI